MTPKIRNIQFLNYGVLSQRFIKVVFANEITVCFNRQGLMKGMRYMHESETDEYYMLAKKVAERYSGWFQGDDLF